MDKRLASVVVGGVAALLTLIALLSPWWTLAVKGGFRVDDESAGPFDEGKRGNDSLIDDSEAAVAGVLVLAALLCMLAGTGLMFLRQMKREASPGVAKLGPWIVAGASLLLILAAILAITTWPSDDLNMDFWDSQSVGGFTITTRASLGWYLAIAAALAAIVGGVMGAMRDEGEAAPVAQVQYARRIQ